ncbi:MAG: tetratricopeptide repeat protein, partial [Myxococcota bacterium]|nr:tetratricopeptide repeat protein [Myxococcota bacterium]
PATAQPPKAEPPQPQPPKAEPPRPQPTSQPAVAVTPKAQPPKPAAPKLAKPTARPAAPGWDPLAASNQKPRPAAAAKPIDPYAAPKRSGDAGAAYKAGIQQFARGDSGGALATFRSSLAVHPEHAPTWRGIGMVYEKLGKRSQARTAFRKYLQLSPGAGDAAQIRDRMERL